VLSCVCAYIIAGPTPRLQDARVFEGRLGYALDILAVGFRFARVRLNSEDLLFSGEDAVECFSLLVRAHSILYLDTA
jgi:hypothetical protein